MKNGIGYSSAMGKLLKIRSTGSSNYINNMKEKQMVAIFWGILAIIIWMNPTLTTNHFTALLAGLIGLQYFLYPI